MRVLAALLVAVPATSTQSSSSTSLTTTLTTTATTTASVTATAEVAATTTTMPPTHPPCTGPACVNLCIYEARGDLHLELLYNPAALSFESSTGGHIIRLVNPRDGNPRLAPTTQPWTPPRTQPTTVHVDHGSPWGQSSLGSVPYILGEIIGQIWVTGSLSPLRPVCPRPVVSCCSTLTLNMQRDHDIGVAQTLTRTSTLSICSGSALLAPISGCNRWALRRGGREVQHRSVQVDRSIRRPHGPP